MTASDGALLAANDRVSLASAGGCVGGEAVR